MYDMMPRLSIKGTNKRFTPVSTAGHVHHGSNFGVNPLALDPKMTQDDLNNIANEGLYQYLLNGGHAPNKEAVRAVQEAGHKFGEQHLNTGYRTNQDVLQNLCDTIQHEDTFMAFHITAGKNFEIGDSLTGFEMDPFQVKQQNEINAIY